MSGPQLAERTRVWTSEPGEIHALVGENGAGKSTLIQIVGGIYQPNGRMLLRGRSCTSQERERRCGTTGLPSSCKSRL